MPWFVQSIIGVVSGVSTALVVLALNFGLSAVFSDPTTIFFYIPASIGGALGALIAARSAGLARPGFNPWTVSLKGGALGRIAATIFAFMITALLVP